ncbi:MAG: flavodoxin [Clostridia bacterium]|jgi:flavodoxin short chain|nr:flavodoxin [Clostridia bacterium]MCI1999141.1 flavodoxin [Clostridia bacterium]MCI2013891.1 flavodoxin [Clostridia bacterium]
MNKISVIYWSQSGNTKAMAEAIGEGIKEAGKEAEVIDVSQVSLEKIKNEAAFALGCPAMGDEVLEESEMEPFVEEIEKYTSGKSIALFGSYGWGDGKWMRDWTERMINDGAKIVNGEGLICQDTPDNEAIDEYKNLGKQLAKIG